MKKLDIKAIKAPIENQKKKNPIVAASIITNTPANINQICHISI